MTQIFGKRTTPPSRPAADPAPYVPKSEAQFLRECQPKLTALELLRLQKLRVFQWRKKKAIPVAAIVTPVLGFIDYWLVMLQRGQDDTAAGISVMGLGALWFWVTSPKRQYAKAYKTKILPEIARLFGDFTYDVKGKIPMSAMKPAGIVPSHTRYKSEDYFRGRYKGVSIELSEMKLTKKQGKRSKTVFDGLSILLSGGTRDFTGHTILVKDKTRLGAWAKSKITGLKPARLVDLDFERLFDVFTTDQTEARYLLDPAIMENLKALQTDYHGQSLSAAFYDDHVLIMIASAHNHFEPAKIDVPATNETELLAMRDEFARVLSIIDALSLITARNKRLYRDKNAMQS